jgi:hypothetical protein
MPRQSIKTEKDMYRYLKRTFKTESQQLDALATLIGAGAKLAGYLYEIKDFIHISEEVHYSCMLICSYLVAMQRPEIPSAPLKREFDPEGLKEIEIRLREAVEMLYNTFKSEGFYDRDEKDSSK